MMKTAATVVMLAVSSVCFPTSQLLNGTSELNTFDPRAHPGQQNARAQEAYTRNRERNRLANVSLVPIRPQRETSGAGSFDKNATFGQRRAPKGKGKHRDMAAVSADGGFEMTWVPSSSKQTSIDDKIASGGDGDVRRKHNDRQKGVEIFGAGMEKGGEDPSIDLSESERKGRTQRRTGIRSGSKNTFRRMES